MTPGPFVIRAATVADLPAICLLAEDLAALHHAAAPHVFAPAGDPTRDEAHWLASLTGTGRHALLAERDGRAAGFATLAVATETHSLLQPMRYARVNSISVAEWARGQGVGRALMAEAERWARAEGAAELRLVVWQFNAAALLMYQELGYSVQSQAMAKRLVENGAP